MWTVYNQEEIRTKMIDGEPFVALADVAKALTLELHGHRLGYRLHDRIAAVQSAKGNWRGIYKGPSVYAPLPGIFEVHGFRVERRTKDGLEFYWIGPGPG